MAEFRVYLLHHIEGNGESLIGWIEVDDVVDTITRNRLDQFFGGVTMRINEGNTMSLLNILDGEILEQVGFAHTCLSDDVHMTPAVIGFDTKSDILIAEVGLGKKSNVIIDG